MIWPWVLGGLATFIALLLLTPIRLQATYPAPKLEIRWFGIAFDLYYQANDMQMRLVLWGYPFKFNAPDAEAEAESKRKKEAKSKKKQAKKLARQKAPKNAPEGSEGKTKRKKWRAKNITWPFLKDLWKNPALSSLLKHCRKFFVRFWKSAKLEKAHIEYCLGDVMANGVLFPIATWFPLPNSFHLEPNFEGKNTANLILKVSLGKILKAFVIFLVGFPYRKTNKLYKSVRRVLRT